MQLLSYARQVCGVFQGFQAQCIFYVEAYGPEALADAIMHLQPALCHEVGVCPGLGAPAAVAQPQAPLPAQA